MPFPNLTPEQRQRIAAILHEVARRAALIRARRTAQLGGYCKDEKAMTLEHTPERCFVSSNVPTNKGEKSNG